MYCTQCNDLICTKCQFSSHKDHNEENIIVDISTYIEQATAQFDTFKDKFKKFIDISTASFPIDDTIFDYLDKQKNVIDVLHSQQVEFVNSQFDTFHKRIEALKDLELDNLAKFRDFFKTKFSDLETKVEELIEEKNEMEDFLDNRDRDFKNFPDLDSFSKEGTVRRIPSDIGVLKQKKQVIMDLFKQYQKHIGESDKIKRYFQRAVMHLKQNKAYDLIRVVEKLHTQLYNKYSSLDLQDYMDNIVVELDEYALVNSRNNAPNHVKQILIACFKSRKVLNYNIVHNNLSVIDADFSSVSIDFFLNFSRSINVNGTLYVNGGWDDNKKQSVKNFFSFELVDNKVIEEPDMLYGHSAHSLLFVPPNYIYCVSGSGTGKCEKYDINIKLWTSIPELNFHRQNSSLFYHNEQYLYVFGGLCWDEAAADFVFVETVERLDIGFGPVIKDQEVAWEVVPTLKSHNQVTLSKSVMTVVPYSSSRILLVGGMFKDQSYSDEVMLFDFDKLEFSLLQDLRLQKKTCFPNKYFLFFGEYAYQFDNEGDIHEFSVKDLSFKVVNQHKPVMI